MSTFWLVALPFAVFLGLLGVSIGGRGGQILVIGGTILASVDLVYLLANR